MGKKDKKGDKQEAKKVRQALKQQKAVTKRSKKELRDAGEMDIEAIIAEFKAKEKAKTEVIINVCDQPSRRANCSMTALPGGEILLFGGEYCDGEATTVFNDVFRWNPDKNEWKKIESLNTPPPRCSHQTVLFNDKVYLFGGEYATMDQFHHYRDFWEFDLKTNSWTELSCTGDLPSARSGHRMIVWRNYLILFGGFYEAMREVRWYNDLFFYSFQESRWMLVPQKPHMQVPKPRSGVQMFLHAAEDILYIFGGYSKQKEGSKQEGKIHEDMWSLHLKPCLPSARSSFLDFDKLMWQKISRKGDYPSPRCGAVALTYKNKAVVFGGVFDSEGPQHSLVSVFYDDLFAFDMERKRWYKLGLKQIKPKEDRPARKQKQKLSSVEVDCENNLEDESDEEDENFPDSKDAGDAAMFGYIDETGAVVYIQMEDELPTETIVVDDNEETTVDLQVDAETVSVVDDVAPVEKQLVSQSVLPENSKALEDSIKPCARINPCMIFRGNSLLIYGGVTESGDVEITLDDAWTLDLNKRDHWKQVLTGTMSSIEWKAVQDDNTESLGDEDGDDDDEDEDDDDDDDDDEGNDGESDSSDDEKLVSVASKKKNNKSNKQPSGLKAEMEMLRAHFDTTDSSRTPQNGETLRDFYSRTSAHWTSEVIASWNSQQQDTGRKNEILSEKEIKREAFRLAELRYEELLPLLSRLNQLEDDQKQEEERFSKKSTRREGRK